MRLLTANHIPNHAISSLHLSEFGSNRVASIIYKRSSCSLIKYWPLSSSVPGLILASGSYSEETCRFVLETFLRRFDMTAQSPQSPACWPVLIQRIIDNVSRCWMKLSDTLAGLIPSGPLYGWKKIFWLFLFLSSQFFSSDSSHLCFSICPYCRKFDF